MILYHLHHQQQQKSKQEQSELCAFSLAGNLTPVGAIDSTIYFPYHKGEEVSPILGTVNILLQLTNITPPFTSLNTRNYFNFYCDYCYFISSNTFHNCSRDYVSQMEPLLILQEVETLA